MPDTFPPDDYDRLIDDAVVSDVDEPPAQVPPSVMALRRRLREFLSQQTAIAGELDKLRESPNLRLTDGAAAALAAVAVNLRHPVEFDEDPRYRAALLKAKEGSLRRHLTDAIDEVAAVRDIAETASKGLHLLDRLGRPMATTWSNLPPAALARAINAECFAIFGGNVIR